MQVDWQNEGKGYTWTNQDKTWMNIWPKTVTAQFQNGDLKESKNELYKTKACKLLRVVKINKTTHGAKRGSCSRALKVKWVSGREGIKNSEVEMS